MSKRSDAAPTFTFAARLRRLLDRKGYSITDAAIAAGMSKQQLWRIVSGDLPSPGIATVERIVDAVGATVPDLYPEFPGENPQKK